MKKLVTISRQFGSGGRIIGARIAEALGVDFYDGEIIDMAIEESGLARGVVEGGELRADNPFTYGMTSAINFGDAFTADPISINEKAFLAQYKVIEEIGAKGEGVIVGRCADYVLRDIKGVTNVFFYGNKEDRIRRCIEEYGEDPKDIEHLIAKYDKSRANYYNYHTSYKWGEITNYNIAINTSYVDYDEAAYLVVEYIKNRRY